MCNVSKMKRGRAHEEDSTHARTHAGTHTHAYTDDACIHFIYVEGMGSVAGGWNMAASNEFMHDS